MRAEVGINLLCQCWRIRHARCVLALMWLADSFMSLFLLECSSVVFKDVATSDCRSYSVGSVCCSLEGNRYKM